MALCKSSQILSFCSKFLFVALFFFVSSAHAAESYTFAEFNIAFILGLTLPVTFIALSLKKYRAINWGYPVTACLSILLQLVAFDHFTQWQQPIILICAASYTACIYYWLTSFSSSEKSVESQLSPLSGQIEQPSLTTFFNYVVGIAYVSLAISLWLFHQVNVYVLWLIFVAIVVVSGMFILLKDKGRQQYELLLDVVLWCSLAIYAVVIYLWLNTKVELDWLISVAILSFFIVILTTSRKIVFHMKAQKKSYGQQAAGNPLAINKSMTPLDPITNLPTHQQGLHQFSLAIQETPKVQFVAIVLKPINFHEVNKVLGHQNSDILLLQLAYNLQQCACEEPTLLNFNFGEPRLKIARLQGLDFLVVLDCSSSTYPAELLVETLCRKLTDAVPQAMSFKSFSLNFELAFGVAISGLHGNTAEQLIAHASDALLDAERAQQRLSYFDYKTAIYSEKQLAKMEQLKRDVLDEQLTWLAHPQVSLVNNQLLGFQLTVDWPNLSSLAPNTMQNDVFQLAEYSGEIHRLSQQYITQAASLLASTHKNNFHVEVSINLSAQVLFEPDLVHLMLAKLEQANVLPKYLVIEINEELFVSHLPATKVAIDQLQANGFSVAINQFSGGFETLRYLRKVAINRVQIDASQLENSQEQYADKAIIDALINVARKMELPVVASGINSQTIAESYLSIGGDFSQGKKVAAPINIPDVGAWLIAWTKQNS